MMRIGRMLAGLILWWAWIGAAEAASFTIRKVVAAGEPAPMGGAFVQFEPIAINRTGLILFDALVQGEESFHAAFFLQGASLSRVVRVGDASPLGGTFTELAFLTLNSRGHVAFLGLVPRDGPFRAIYVAKGVELVKVVAVKDETPAEGYFLDFNDLALNDRDAIAFFARVQDGKVQRALFLASDGRIEQLVAVADSSPAGGRFTQFINLSLNNKNEMAFEGLLHGAPISSGIFVASKAGVRKVVAEGDPSPLGGRFMDFAAPLLNDAGDLVFWASLEGAARPAGLFLASRGTVQKIVARGDPAPRGGRFSYISFPCSFSGSGAVAFRAKLVEDRVSAGIFLAHKGVITPVARVGDPTPIGGRFADLSAPKIDSDGTVLFAAEVVQGQAESGLFLALPAGKP